MGANNPRGITSLGPRVLIGRIYVGEPLNIATYSVIYLPFGSTESKGLTWLIFNESQDKIKSPLHILQQFSILFCEFRDLHV